MLGQPSILGMVQKMIGEKPFLLQIENELPDLMLTDLSYICASPLGGNKILKVTHAVADDSYGVWDFPLSYSAKLAAMK